MMNPEPNSVPNIPNRVPQNVTADDSPWWLKYVVRAVATASALAALILGAMQCVTLSPGCLMAGIVQMLCGVLVAIIEAPCFCMFLDFAQIPSNFFDRKPFWHRGMLYIIISILPIAICPGVRTFFGSGLIFVTGSLYGIIALGKKASFEEMRVKATSSYNLLPSPAHRNVETEKQTAVTIESQKPSGAV